MRRTTQHIILGADHRGFRLKESIKRFLEKQGRVVVDAGAHTYVNDDDYPQYALRVAHGVVDKHALGILFCGSGIGMSIAANKIRGVRAGLVTTSRAATAGRIEDHMNIVVLAADTTTDAQARRIIRAFLNTPPSDAARYRRRVRTVNAYGTRT